MTNPYSMNAYSQQQNVYYAPQVNKSKLSGVVPIATLGFLGAGTVGFLKHKYPVSADGVVSDSFAKKAFENHVKKNFNSEKKKLYEQTKNFLKKADSINTVEDFKKFLNVNKELAESCASGIKTSTKEFIESMTSTNFKNTKDSLKEMLVKNNNFNIEQFKSFTQTCWNKDTKKFVKADSVSDKVFKIIKNTSANNQWCKALKYGGIGAVVAGALTLAYNFLMQKNNNI